MRKSSRFSIAHTPASIPVLDRKYNIIGKLSGTAATAYNERFGVIVAVSPQIMQWELANYYTAASSVEAATTQSRHHVSGHAERVGRIEH
jgi:hypothetical protein